MATNPNPPTRGDSCGISSLPSGPTLPCLCWNNQRLVSGGPRPLCPADRWADAQEHAGNISPLRALGRAAHLGAREEDPWALQRTLRPCQSSHP